MSDRLLQAPDGQWRCRWCETPGFDAYRHYHDQEWGYPVDDDRRLFEKLCLEGFQSGLSWRTILAKREAFRAAFSHFDIERVARFDEADIERLLADAGIVRHRGKIEAAIHNAGRALALQQEAGSLAAFFWRHEETGLPPHEVRGASDGSRTLSKALKQRGWKFVGPTTVYAFMQAMGLVNDHAPGCIGRNAVDRARARFRLPT
ncbi:DNA-3-methyladenine glycosylase I [Roseateles amylovorans]|uniref:DNA-3-methyladenine glycosylase I n=1 Tax=Roseateles amylovorans TaxID=2978473 RepID=A0ABY6B1U1_9BURK|nr:DNA-3-methyladenine glycosylase I [Roseateles amylovorans]UXH78887.1 DNA-3-methyladenine glycosylase I [Roseateles amylovorans]